MSNLDCDLRFSRGGADDVSCDSFKDFPERPTPKELGQGQLVALEVGHRSDVLVCRDDATETQGGDTIEQPVDEKLTCMFL